MVSRNLRRCVPALLLSLCVACATPGQHSGATGEALRPSAEELLDSAASAEVEDDLLVLLLSKRELSASELLMAAEAMGKSQELREQLLELYPEPKDQFGTFMQGLSSLQDQPSPSSREDAELAAAGVEIESRKLENRLTELTILLLATQAKNEEQDRLARLENPPAEPPWQLPPRKETSDLAAQLGNELRPAMTELALQLVGRRAEPSEDD